MKKMIKYIENIWLGDDKKPSLKRVLAMLFSCHIVHLANVKQDLVSAAMVIGIEAGLVAALLGLASYQSIQYSKEKPQ